VEPREAVVIVPRGARAGAMAYRKFIHEKAPIKRQHISIQFQACFMLLTLLMCMEHLLVETHAP
jgi:hypothetical protein